MARRRRGADTKRQDGWGRVPVSSVVSVNPHTPTDIDDEATLVSHFAMGQLDEFRGTLREPELVPYERCRSGKAKFVEGDVLFAKITPCVQNGKSALVAGLDSRVGFGSSEFYVLRPSRRVLREFLFFFVRQRSVVQAAVDSFTGTSGRQRVPRNFWDQLEIPVPPLPVQERIVDVLHRADAVRVRHQEGIDLTNALLPALYRHMFGEPRENPRCWPIEQVGDHLEETRYGTSEKTRLTPPGDPVLRIPNVVGGEIDLTELKYLEVSDVERDRLMLRQGDLLVVRTNGNRDYVGRCAVFDLDGEYLYASYLIRLRTNPKTLDPWYLASYLTTSFGRQEIAVRTRTSAGQYNISAEGLRALRLPIPPMELQKRFAVQVGQWMTARQRQLAGLESSASSLRALLGRAFTGELTAAWESTHRETLMAQQALHTRLPQLVLLGFLTERARRAAQGAAASLWLTALMKYAFLLQMEGTAKAQIYRFVPYHYGPFAKEVYTDLEALREQGLVSVESRGDEVSEDETYGPGLLHIAEAIAPHGSRRPRKIETPRMVIAIADPKAADRTLQDLPVDLREDICAILDAYGDLAHNALLDAVYEKYPAFAKKSRLKRAAGKKPKEKGIRRRQKR